ncbi:MAG: LysR family transcriptional regulator [Clostridia bacterium]|nr:LysR family transcriptional regulator [Clostridia bacterium]
MTLQQLSYFLSACRHGSISAAAKEFGVSQPAVSDAIKKLEAEFDTALISRYWEGILLTEDGTRLCKMAESLVLEAESVKKAMLSHSEKRLILRLGVPPMVASVLYPGLYARFAALHPEVEVITREMGRSDLIAALDDGLLDLVFLPHTDPFGSEYVAFPVADFETVCCTAASHPLSQKKSLTPEDLRDVPLVLFSKGFYHTERIDAFFASAGLRPRVMHTSSQLSTVEEFAARGLAAGFLFLPLVQKNPDLVPISLSPPMVTHISLVHCRGLGHSEAREVFLSFMAQENEKKR